MANSVAEKARKTAEKYSGAGQSFEVKYLGTQEVSSAKGDAVIADCLKELRTLFKDVAIHLPKVVITLQMSGITVIDDKSKLETIKVPLEKVSYVCLDPADESVFSFIIRSDDTISSKGLRLHAFVTHPQIAIQFNRSTWELFDFMARMMRAKRKLAEREAQPATTHSEDTPVKPSATPHEQPVTVTIPVIAPPPPASREQTQTTSVQEPAGDTSGLLDAEKRQQAVFDEWKQLEKELDNIGKDLGIDTAVQGPITSTPTSSPSVTSAIDPSISSDKPFPEATGQLQPAQLDVVTASGSDPFGNSFFDLSFGGPQPPATSAAPGTTAADPHLFDNPVFGAHSDKPKPRPEPEMLSTALASTPEIKKQLTYASRPRPKGKVLDVSMLMSPPPIPDTPDSTTDSRNARDISLSPTGELEVKSILANTDPFSPPNGNTFQFPPSVTNGPGIFQPTPFDTPNSGVFSPQSISAQESIQLINPLYQSYSPSGSYSAPFSPPLQQPQPHAMMMMMMSPPVFGGVQSPLMVQQMQSVPAMGQPQVKPMPLMGTNTFDGIVSPTVINAPAQTGAASLSGQPPSHNTVLNEQRDTMFADLLPSTSHPLPEKKREFEPETKKVTSPTLAQLQEKKKKEEEEAFRASTEETPTEETDWPLTPFDTASPNTSFPEPLGDFSTPSPASLSTGDQQVPIKQQEKATGPHTPPLDDFDEAFQAAGRKEDNFESAFEVKVTAKPQPLSPTITNDPFLPNGTVASPEQEKPTPWSIF